MAASDADNLLGLDEALTDRLWSAVAEVRDSAARTPDDADTYDIVEAVLGVMLDFDPIPATRGDVQVVTFRWSRQHGDCHDCARPAAFYLPVAYGAPQPPNAQNKRCAVCAAGAAADGETVQRIDADA